MAFVLLPALSLGCSKTQGDPLNGEPAEDPLEAPGGPTCIDKDGDGFGAGCGNGLDCNDEDPMVGPECYECVGNPTGCPCTIEGSTFACGELSQDAAGQPVCLMGEKTCVQGKWSACIAKGEPRPLLKTMDLSDEPDSCDNNPCDPYCQHFPDSPDPSLTNDSGIVGTDTGLQLAVEEIDAGPPEECVNESAQADIVPLDIYVMLDKSGSMNWYGRWDAVTDALKTFVNDSNSTGITVALDYFPDGGWPSYCDWERYDDPAVAWIALPGGASTIESSLDGTGPGGNTPTRPALEGAIAYARARETAMPTHKSIVVLATDGDPTSCSNNSIYDVRDEALAGRTGTPAIETYVIGVGNVANLDLVAAAGSNTSAYIVSSGDASAFLAAMNDIRQQALGCEFTIPANPGTGNIDPDETLVSFKYGDTGTPTELTRYTDEAACGTNDGYYYDDPTYPTTLYLCSNTCDTIGSDSNYRVDLTFLCHANCGSSESAIEPIPLEMYVMLDKSGSMDGSRWNAVTSALETFVDSSQSTGITVALDFFPLPESYPAQCSLSNYTTPAVPWGILPDVADSFKNALSASENQPYGGTPTEPALRGAIQYCRDRKVANPENTVITVLATDGQPNNCSSSPAINYVAAAAAEGLAGGGGSATVTVTSVSETFEDIQGSGTNTGLSGDDHTVGPFNIGFDFPYYGQNFNEFYVDTNGYISLTSPGGSHYSNDPVPYTSAPNGIIAPFWDDLIIDGGVYYEMLGTAPNRRLVVQFDDARHYGDSGDMNFEVVLWESGDISFRYGLMDGDHSNGDSATVGVENISGLTGHQYSYNSAFNPENDALRFEFSSVTSWPSIPTYVIGVGYSTGMDLIAAAGGTGSAFIVDGGDSSAFLAAMNQIRMQALGCEYTIPPSSLGHVDPSALTVRYVEGGTGTIYDFPLVDGAGFCGSTTGFYYNDPADPTSLTLCPAACTQVGADSEAQLNIFYDCLDAYADGIFIRDYSAEGMCPPGSSHVWDMWSWEADTPSDSHIDFTVAAAYNLADLSAAAQHPLVFTFPPGPESQEGNPIVAQAGTPDTRTGSAKVDTTLAPFGALRKATYLRVRAKLHASNPYGAETPVLTDWELSVTCEASE